MRKLCFFGAAPDTGNLGVSALCFGVLGALFRRSPDAAVTVLDYGRAVRPAVMQVGGASFAYERCGAFSTRRLYRPECLWNMRLSVRLHGLGNPGARRLLRSDTVLDISGGDSFTDLCGPWRWRAVALPKQIALEAKRPLILLPQTYGPFKDAKVRAEASRLVRGAAQAWARDARSFAVMRELLGDSFDPRRHRSGVDVAFLLEPRPPRHVPPALSRFMENRARPIAGVNISGLLYNQELPSRSKYGLVTEYRAAVHALVRRLLDDGALVLLVPHVVTQPGHYESDIEACQQVAAATGGGESIHVAPAFEDPAEAKWLIAQCSWFCGTRMHATIAGLSSSVATAAMAYSGKTLGVFETCGQGEHVADMVHQGTDEVLEIVWRSWSTRESSRASLLERISDTMAQAERQMDEILGAPTGAERLAEAVP